MNSKGKSLWIFAVMLVSSITLTLSSCKDDIKVVRPPLPGGGSSSGVPQEDDLKVKVLADLPTAVRSEFDETSMGAALQNQFSNLYQPTREMADQTP